MEVRRMADDGALPGVAFDQRVTVHQLRLFTAVAAHSSFSRAAESLGLSQPAVSHQLKALRLAIGMPLIEIVGRQVRLTAAGEILYGHARRILAEFELAAIALDELRDLRRGVLRIVADTTVGIYVMPDVLGAFRHENPNIDLRLDIGNRHHLLDRLTAGDVDFAVGGRSWIDPPIPLVVLPFLANELIAIASPANRLAGSTSVRLRDFAAEPFIGREIGSGTRETTEEALRRAGHTVRPIMEFASNGAIKRAVARDLGVSVVSRFAAALEIRLGLLVELPVEGFPLQRQWHHFRAQDRSMSPAAAAFARFLADGRWRESIGQDVSTE
jgi:DNA-binding transcriptional LysR family regulator